MNKNNNLKNVGHTDDKALIVLFEFQLVTHRRIEVRRQLTPIHGHDEVVTMRSVGVGRGGLELLGLPWTHPHHCLFERGDEVARTDRELERISIE